MLAHDLLIVLPEEVLTLSALALMLVAAWAGDRAAKLSSWLAVLAFVIAALVLPGIVDPGDTAFSGMFAGDSFAAFSKVVIYAAAAASLLAAIGWFGRAGDLRAELPVLVLLASVGMGIMVSATDLLTLYVGLELQNLALYVLAAFRRDDTRSAEAGLKYFVLSALASGLVLYGISLLYGFTGSTLFSQVAAGIAGGLSTGELFGLVFLLAGLAFKISAVPFHMWAPDVYQGAPTPISAFFATAPKLAAMALIARVLVEATGPATASWQQMVIFMALASTILGGVAAIAQKNIKRLLAYSSINNVGFALVGLAAGTPEGISSVLFYMTVYIVMTFGAFLIVLRMRDQDGRPVETIASLRGLSRTRPWLAFGMMIFMFSLAGIPPLFGFWPKFVVFNAAVAADLAWLAAVAIATSVISAFYYIMIVKTMFFDEPAPAYGPTRDPVTAALVVGAALFVSPLGYLSIGPLDHAATIAADALFPAQGYSGKGHSGSIVPAGARRGRRGEAGPSLGGIVAGSRDGGHREQFGQAMIELRSVPETGSTNDDVAALAAAGAAEGLWLRADRQSAGKGRQGRAWDSPPGNLYASTLVRVRPGDPPPATLALVSAVALHEAVAPLLPPPGPGGEGMAWIKWPNDLIVGGAKLAGILLERRDDAVVVGFGANLASHPHLPERPATSIRALAGRAPAPHAFLARLAEAFARGLSRWRAEGLAPVRAAWLAAAHPIGTPLAVGEVRGTFDGLDESGALRLRLAGGETRLVHAGDVFLI